MKKLLSFIAVISAFGMIYTSAATALISSICLRFKVRERDWVGL